MAQFWWWKRQSVLPTLGFPQIGTESEVANSCKLFNGRLAVRRVLGKGKGKPFKVSLQRVSSSPQAQSKQGIPLTWKGRILVIQVVIGWPLVISRRKRNTYSMSVDSSEGEKERHGHRRRRRGRRSRNYRTTEKNQESLWQW